MRGCVNMRGCVIRGCVIWEAIYLDHTADKGPLVGLWRKREGDLSNNADSLKGLSWWVVVGGGGGGVDEVDDDDVGDVDVDDDTPSIPFGEQSGAYTRRSYPHPPIPIPIPIPASASASAHREDANQDDPGNA